MRRVSNLYPVGSVAACDANFGRKKEGKFLLCDRFWSLPVRSFDFLDGLLKKREKKQLFTSKTEPPPSWDIASGAYHVSEGSARALAGCVVLEDGRVVDQLADVITARGEKSANLKIKIFRQCNRSKKFIVCALWNVALFYHNIYVFHIWQKRQLTGSCILHGFKYMKTDFNGQI